MGRFPLPVRKALLIALAFALPLPATAAVERFCGYAYDTDKRFRYTEHHAQDIVDGRWVGGTIRYVGPDGQEIGNKSLSFADNPMIPVYRLELFGGKYIEGIESVANDSVLAFRKEPDDRELRREKISFSTPASADSGFHSLIRANLPTLLAGERKQFSFIVAGALDQYRFRVRRAGEATFEGQPAVRLLAEPDSLLRWLVDPLDLTYNPDTGQLLEYRGPTNLRDAKTRKGYDVRISFFSTPPADVPEFARTGCPTAAPTQDVLK